MLKSYEMTALDKCLPEETNRIEYKQILTDDFERQVVAFLNYSQGGEIYIGVDKHRNAIGVAEIDLIQQKIVDRIKNNVLPSTLGLFDVIVEKISNHEVIKVVIASGVEKPYYLRSKGMSPAGCFIRVGSSVQPMTTTQIDTLYAKRISLKLSNIPAPRQNLTFQQLEIYYSEKKLKLNDEFFASLDLVDVNGRYNYVAYLLADENGVSIKVAKYAGTTKVDLIENEEYGYRCLITAANRVLDKLRVENKTFAKITPKARLEQSMVDATALREAFINAIVHNDYSREVPPVVEIFSDRLTITSYGGLPQGLSRENFFRCRSMPRNRELMRVFKDVGLVEQLGSGMSRILEIYDPSIFTFEDEFLIVTFPFTKGFTLPRGNVNGNVNSVDVKNQILTCVIQNPSYSLAKIAEKTGYSKRTVSRQMKMLQETVTITRVGSPKTGHWEVIQQTDSTK
ncbi:MAG: putative DNA binding domain-containing protein [Candidatus Bathyarchaeota archaeon]|nr:putative DNA binding domain-containing protein [Candidatus Termiticorpusculum sp.]